MTDWLMPGVLFATLAVDHIAVGQFMFSRPLVVAAVLGAWFGNPELGLVAGVTGELLWVHVIPVGIWPIDTAVVTALAVSWCLASARPDHATLVLAMLLAVPCGVAMRKADVWFRRNNNRMNAWVEAELSAGRESVLSRAVAFSLAFWWAKAWLLFTACYAAGRLVMAGLLRVCPDRVLGGLDVAGRALPLLGLCVVLNYFWERSRPGIAWTAKPWTP
jgi:mannose/fructose/N-acetylgalactosamine-specific phosphotransferase system component IIC